MLRTHKSVIVGPAEASGGRDPMSTLLKHMPKMLAGLATSFRPTATAGLAFHQIHRAEWLLRW